MFGERRDGHIRHILSLSATEFNVYEEIRIEKFFLDSPDFQA